MSSDGLDSMPFGDRKISVLIIVMQTYPYNAPLLRSLLNHGWNPEVTIREVIEPTTGEEAISAPLWALLQPQKRISDSVVRELLEAAPSVTRPSPTSDMTPLRSPHAKAEVTSFRPRWPPVRDAWV